MTDRARTYTYGLVAAELGSAFPQEGGPYVWVRLAFGRTWAAVATTLYWITNPVWLGGSLAFLAAATWSAYVHPLAGLGDLGFKLVFIWLAIAVAVISIRRGKVLLNIGAITKVAVIAIFVVTVGLHALRSGVHGHSAADFAPTLGGFLAVAPIILFAFVGFEAPNGAAEEMTDARRDVPVSVATSATVSALCHLIPVLGILLVMPPGSVTGVSGFMDAVRVVFDVYGPGREPMLVIVALAVVFILLSQGAAWMVASDRVQAIAGADDAFPRFFGRFHPSWGTPLRVNLLSGAVATIFCIAATLFASGGGAVIFTIVLSIAVSTLLLSYLIIFPAALRLRRRYPHAERPYRVPGGTAGLWIASVPIIAWIVVGSWSAVFPGSIEALVGLDYDFEGTWGVGRGPLEAFTLATLGVILALALGGCWWARRHAHGPSYLDPLAAELEAQEAAGIAWESPTPPGDPR